MCGIFGYIGHKNNAKDIVLSGLKTLEYRGYDSWGIAVTSGELPNKKITVFKQVGKIGEANIESLPRGDFALGHTRWATHGGVIAANAHPILDCTSRLAIIHNGIIENYDSIKKELLNIGHRFTSETDTEVAVHLIEETLKKDYTEDELIKAVKQSFNRFLGLNAIILMDSVTHSFIAVKNGSPLVIGKGKNENLVASDAHALLKYTRDVYFLNDNEIALVKQDKIDIYNLGEDKKKTVSFTRLNWPQIHSSKGKYKHFMLKEIYDQLRVLKEIKNDSVDNIRYFSELIKKSYGTYLVGCGSAAYACLAGTYIFSKIAKAHINYSVGSEFGYSLDFLTDKSLIIALSQSGETIDVIDAVKKAKKKKAKIGAFVNVIGSTLYRISDYKLLLNAGVEKAVVTTKAFTAKIAYLLLIAYMLDGSYKKGTEILGKSIESLKGVLSYKSAKNIRKLINIIKDKEHIYIIGRGLSYPIALETALKIKESSYTHAEGFAAGELKHGVIALVEKNTPCIAFLPNDETYSATLAGAMEMKARGGFIVGISHKPNDIFDYYINFEDCGIASIIPSVVIGQLIGYYLAITKGLDPDKPRNLAKSVTVK